MCFSGPLARPPAPPATRRSRAPPAGRCGERRPPPPPGAGPPVGGAAARAAARPAAAVGGPAAAVGSSRARGGRGGARGALPEPQEPWAAVAGGSGRGCRSPATGWAPGLWCYCCRVTRRYLLSQVQCKGRFLTLRVLTKPACVEGAPCLHAFNRLVNLLRLVLLYAVNLLKIHNIGGTNGEKSPFLPPCVRRVRPAPWAVPQARPGGLGAPT